MRLIKSHERTTLFLNRHFFPTRFLTAKRTINLLMSNRVRGIDSYGNILQWMDDSGGPCWFSKNVGLYPDNPALSTKRGNDEVTLWPIPTIVLSSSYSGLKVSNESRNHLSFLYLKYKGVCPLCGKKKPYREMTREHIVPKSKGGGNNLENISISCQPCNNKRGSITPLRDFKNEIISKETVSRSKLILPEIVREEWKPYFNYEK